MSSERTVSFFSTVPNATGFMWWANSSCLIAGGKICPTSHPYYDSSTNLCHDSCLGQNTASYLCAPVYICPSNCKYCSSNAVCTNCSFGYYLSADSQCYSSCLAGTFANDESQTCDLCPTGCATCAGLNICQTCQEPYVLKGDNLCHCPPNFSFNSLN